MRRKSRYAIMAGALLAGSALSMSALALDESDFTFDTTKNLVQVCSAEGEGEGVIEAQLACRAFVEAAVQYHDAVSDRKKMKRLICYPGTTTIADATGVFVAWGKKNAGDAKLMGELPVVGLTRALAETYPCK